MYFTKLSVRVENKQVCLNHPITELTRISGKMSQIGHFEGRLTVIWAASPSQRSWVGSEMVLWLETIATRRTRVWVTGSECPMFWNTGWLSLSGLKKWHEWGILVSSHIAWGNLAFLRSPSRTITARSERSWPSLPQSGFQLGFWGVPKMSLTLSLLSFWLGAW